MTMTWAYTALARVNGKPAGHCGTWIDKAHYQPYPSSPGVIWRRTRVPREHAELMRQRQCSHECIVMELREVQKAEAPCKS